MEQISKKETYDAVLKDILAFSDGKRILPVAKIAEYLGHSRPWVYRHFGVDCKGGMTAFELAKRVIVM